jgi:hypothetical protein
MSNKTIGQCMAENLLLKRTKQVNDLRRLLRDCGEVFRDNLKMRNYKDEASMLRCYDEIQEVLKPKRRKATP